MELKKVHLPFIVDTRFAPLYFWSWPNKVLKYKVIYLYFFKID
jgi:hypothetical protein